MSEINSLGGLNNENVDFRPTVELTAPKNDGTAPLQPESDVALKNARVEAVEELRAAFAELESGEGLTRLVGGHGIQSRVFEFEWSEPALEISFRMPYARVLSDEASQKDDDEEIGAAIRMAILLLTAAGRMESVSRIEVSCDDRGTTYAVYAAGGELEDSGTDWGPLVKRLEAELGDDSEPVSIIWP